MSLYDEPLSPEGQHQILGENALVMNRTDPVELLLYAFPRVMCIFRESCRDSKAMVWTPPHLNGINVPNWNF